MKTVLKHFLLCCAFLTVLNLVTDAKGQGGDELKWWKGNLHTHTLWSDGDDFPDMVAKRFLDRGYHFLALTDHNVLSQNENKWMDVAKVKARSGETAMKSYQAAFGSDWVELRDHESSKQNEDAVQQVRLKTLPEIRSRFESPGKFLMIEAEEISDRAEGKPIHLNATNLRSVITPVGGKTVVETINNNIRAVAEQAERNGEPIMVHLNHPNFGWAVTAEELAAITNGRFFEVYNGHPSINHLGDKKRVSIEKMWDIANTIRISQLSVDPIFGVGTDDSHHYHDRKGKTARMGRGWVMVKSKELSATSLIEAMNRGDFYSTSGVQLDSVELKDGTLSIKIHAEPGVTYKTEFIGTMKDYDREATVQLDGDGKPIRATKVYSMDVGQVFSTSESLTPNYKLSGNELFVRAVVTSSKSHTSPSFTDQFEQAWTQPVGWR